MMLVCVAPAAARARFAPLQKEHGGDRDHERNRDQHKRVVERYRGRH